MSKMIPIAISILRCNDKYLFLKRRNPPYENLWSLVGGKVDVGEHIIAAGRREISEETGASQISEFELKGVVSERLVSPDGRLVAHFLIFVGFAAIDSFKENHREGELSLFSESQLESIRHQILPSDYEMFSRLLHHPSGNIAYHEAELIQDNGTYRLEYYREGSS